MGYYSIRKIEPWLYSLYDPQSVYCYLVVGEEKALLYDTAYGIGNLPEAVREITDKPLTVALGHGHIDHANGAYQFESAYLDRGDFELCANHTSPQIKETIVKGLADKPQDIPAGFDPDAYIKSGAGNLIELEPGTVFDLGGINAEVVAMPGHTGGSVGLLLREKRVMLVSDAANAHIWMFLEESLPISEYAKMLDCVYALDFDTFYVGHGDDPQPKEMFMKYKKVALEAAVEKAVPYSQFPELEPYLYEDGGVGIVFSRRTLNGG